VQKHYLSEMEKINQLLIAQSLSNICAVNYESRIMFARVTVKMSGILFLTHSVVVLTVLSHGQKSSSCYIRLFTYLFHSAN